MLGGVDLVCFLLLHTVPHIVIYKDKRFVSQSSESWQIKTTALASGTILCCVIPWWNGEADVWHWSERQEDRQTGRQMDKQTYKWLPTRSAYSTMTCIHSAHNPVTSILPRQSQWQGAVGMGFGEACTPESVLHALSIDIGFVGLVSSQFRTSWA